MKRTREELAERPIPQVDLPSRIYKKNIEWYKGLFVAANVGRNEDGSPKFGTVNHDWVVKAWETRTCQLCGRRIAKRDFACFPGRWGLGAYEEAPLHVECCEYSMSVCPMIKSRRSMFGVAVCVEYDIVGSIAEGFVVRPNLGKYPQWAELALTFAHSIEQGTNRCRTCPDWADDHFLGALTYDEFMFWGKP